MCRKRERHCREYEDFRQAAYAEWEVAEELEEVRAAWSRFGGLVTLHRYGRQHFSLLARHRWGDAEASQLLTARMIRRHS
jgi:hypothetical protein